MHLDVLICYSIGATCTIVYICTQAEVFPSALFATSASSVTACTRCDQVTALLRSCFNVCACCTQVSHIQRCTILLLLGYSIVLYKAKSKHQSSESLDRSTTKKHLLACITLWLCVAAFLTKVNKILQNSTKKGGAGQDTITGF
jgi:hypothetical protein